VVKGAVVKTNEPTSRNIVTFVRNDDGILVDRTEHLQALRPAWDDLQDELIAAVRDQAKAGLPFTKTGAAGLYDQRERLPQCLRNLPRDRLQDICQELIEAGKIVKCKATGSNIAKWLDVPGGQFALGLGEFKDGAEIVDFTTRRG
jgi:hypothetical protein